MAMLVIHAIIYTMFVTPQVAGKKKKMLIVKKDDRVKK